MTIIEALVDLQEVDGRIRELEAELKDLPKRKRQLCQHKTHRPFFATVYHTPVKRGRFLPNFLGFS